MTAITFPSNPQNGDTHSPGNGMVYTYDGEKWTSVGTNSAGTWTRTGTTVSLTTAGDDLDVDSGALYVDASTNNVLINTTTASGSSLFQVNDSSINIRSPKTVTTSSSSGSAGDIAWDADYIYICTGANTWKRAAISTW